MQQTSHPQRSTNVGNIASARMESRHPDSPPPTNGSHDAGSPPKPISTSRMASRWSWDRHHNTDDDSEDIASLTSQQSTPLQQSQMTWSLTLSSKTTDYALKSLPTPSPLSGRSMSGVPRFSDCHQHCSWPTTGEGALASCLILPPPMPSHLTCVGLLFKFLT